MEDSIRYLLRNPVISKASVDRPNIMLACEEIPSSIHRKDFSYFASKVSEMLQSDESAIVYTDFIDDVGPIMSELSNHGIDSVAYYGEMDIRSRNESFDRWRNGDVNVMVATSAFGMGINKPNIRHIIRYGVPENICSWAQELGRAGRDGNPAKATIFYSTTNIEHGGAWIKGHLNNQEHCSRILNEFSESWKYVMSDVVNQCRRSSLLREEDKELVKHSKCCDVCEFTAESVKADLFKELQILYDAIQTLGSKGELKITQWIRGSGLAWTDTYNKLRMNSHHHLSLCP